MAKSGIIVEYNHIPEVKSKILFSGKAIVKEILTKISEDIEAQGPYRELLKAKVSTVGGIGKVDVSPWWIGFIELGTVNRAARPFVGPISQRAFNTLVPKFRVMGDRL